MSVIIAMHNLITNFVFLYYQSRISSFNYEEQILHAEEIAKKII